MSLIKKLTEKTKKRIVATVLAGGIALSGLGMTGCTSCNPDPNNTNPPITNPGGDNGGTIVATGTPEEIAKLKEMDVEIVKDTIKNNFTKLFNIDYER